MRRAAVSWVLVSAVSLVACSEEAPVDPETALLQRGEKIYLGNCIACHARDPSQAGPVGPALAGSSLELLQAKVLRNEYPPGYTPKRDSNAMVALPHLEPEIPALAAYLGSIEPQE